MGPRDPEKRAHLAIKLTAGNKGRKPQQENLSGFKILFLLCRSQIQVSKVAIASE